MYTRVARNNTFSEKSTSPCELVLHLGASKGKHNKNIFPQNLMVPPDPHIFTITCNGVHFLSVAELLKVNETS